MADEIYAQLIAVLKSRTNQTNTERENLERLNGIVRVRVNAILEDGKQKSKDVFVLNGFYPGMSCDDAEILLGWYYPDAKVEQWVDNDDGDRYVTLDGRKICFANRKGEVSKLDFPAKVLFDWLGFEDSNLRCWIEKFRSKFDLPEFTFDVEQNTVSAFTETGVVAASGPRRATGSKNALSVCAEADIVIATIAAKVNNFFIVFF